jgi:hypothetical protein
MKFATVSKSVVLVLALVFAATAFAATKGNLELTNPVVVNGTTLKAGDYKVQWEGSGPNVELSILRGKNVVAKVPAHTVELQSAPENDAAVTRQSSSGPNELAGIRFHGQKTAFEIGESSDGMQAGGSSK